MANSVAEHTKRTTHDLCVLQAYEIHTARLLGGWLPGVVRWEVKHEVARHLWEDAQHSQALRTRLWELRVPNPDREVSERVVSAVEALGSAQSDVEMLAGVYLVLKKGLLEAYQARVTSIHPIYDAPSVPVLKRIIMEKEAQLGWAERAVAELAASGDLRRGVKRWTTYAEDVLAAAGGVAGTGETSAPPTPPPGTESLLPFMEAKRDERFDVQLETGIKADKDDRLGQVLYQFANYGAEMQAAETLGSTLWEAEDMPWEFYFDLARHLYDEARHSQLGAARLSELGYHVTDFPHSVANYTWRQFMDPMRRYCTLTYVIEADSFAYKHETYSEHLKHDDHESAQALLFDITDETMHVRWGKKWVPELMKRYAYEGEVNDLVAECRALTAKNSSNPLQRSFADRVKGAA